MKRSHVEPLDPAAGRAISEGMDDQLTEREAALFARTRREVLVDLRDEFARYETRRPSFRERSTRGHARWAAGIIDRVLERLDRISGPPPELPPLQDQPAEVRP